MDISGLSSSTSAQNAAASVSGKAKSIGKEAFLELLVTQLKNQNPLEPMDNLQFVTQLAQFSELEGISNLGDSLNSIDSLMASMNNFGAANLVGKTVSAYGNSVELQDSGSVPLQYSLDNKAKQVSIAVYSLDGTLVKTIDAGAQGAGGQSVIWDGIGTDGGRVTPGTYNIYVNAKDSDGLSVGTRTFANGIVNKVVFENGTPYLFIGSQKVSLQDVVEIKEQNTG